MYVEVNVYAFGQAMAVSLEVSVLPRLPSCTRVFVCMYVYMYMCIRFNIFVSKYVAHNICCEQVGLSWSQHSYSEGE